MEAVKHCQQLARTADWEGFMVSLFVPTSAWRATWAIRAFNVETALIRDHVKDVTIGRMRIQFWRDAIAQTFEVSMTVCVNECECGLSKACGSDCRGG